MPASQRSSAAHTIMPIGAGISSQNTGCCSGVMSRRSAPSLQIVTRLWGGRGAAEVGSVNALQATAALSKEPRDRFRQVGGRTGEGRCTLISSCVADCGCASQRGKAAVRRDRAQLQAAPEGQLSQRPPLTGSLLPRTRPATLPAPAPSPSSPLPLAGSCRPWVKRGGEVGQARGTGGCDTLSWLCRAANEHLNDGRRRSLLQAAAAAAWRLQRRNGGGCFGGGAAAASQSAGHCSPGSEQLSSSATHLTSETWSAAATAPLCQNHTHI